MKILVTGSRGFIGSHLMKRIKATGIDLRDGKDLLKCRLPKADVIYHLAAQTSVESSWCNPLKDSYNFNMIVRLVKEYPRSKIIYAQSAASLRPMSSPYAFSKSICADYLQLFHNNYRICMFPNVYGGGNGVVDLFKGKKEVTIYGDGEQVRDFVHVDDIVDGLIQAEGWPVGEYMMGSGKGTKIKELVQGRKVKWERARREIKESVLENTTPGWEPVIDVIKYLNA